MTPHALSWESDAPTSDTRDVSHARSLTRQLSNLSQASTLVGSESDDIDIAYLRLSTAAQFPVANGVAREFDVVEPSTLDQTDVNEDLEEQYRDMRNKALERVKALHAFCDPIMGTVGVVSIKLDAAERSLEGQQHLTAHHLFRDIINDIDRLIREGLDMEGIRRKIEQQPLLERM